MLRVPSAGLLAAALVFSSPAAAHPQGDRSAPVPVAPTLQADYDEQFRVSMEVVDTIAALRGAIERVRSLREDADTLRAWAGSAGSEAGRIPAIVDSFIEDLSSLERALTSYQTSEGPSGRRTVAGLDRQYGSLMGHLNGGGGYGPGSTEGRPTAGAMERKHDLDALWSAVAGRLNRLLGTPLETLNGEARRVGGPGVGNGG